MKVNLLVEFNKEKYNLKYTESIHKAINCRSIYTFPDKCKKEKVKFVSIELMNNLAKCLTSN